MSRTERLALVSREGTLSVATQCRLLDVSRRDFYRPSRKVPEDDLAMIRRLNELRTAYPFYGAHQLVAALRLQGVFTGRNRVRRLMREMGLSAVVPKSSTSLKAPSHKVFPYLLRGMGITETNQVWCLDITHIPMRGASCTWRPP